LHCAAAPPWVPPGLVTWSITTASFDLVRIVCQRLAGCHLELAFRESPSAREPADCMEIFGLVYRTCLRLEESWEAKMDVNDRLRELMELSFLEICTLPESSVSEFLDAEGRRFQRVTWCERIAPQSLRVAVSLHRIHGLGISSLYSASGFSMSSSGEIEMLDPSEVEKLFA
jgi:hypothetical protein